MVTRLSVLEHSSARVSGWRERCEVGNAYLRLEIRFTQAFAHLGPAFFLQLVALHSLLTLHFSAAFGLRTQSYPIYNFGCVAIYVVRWQSRFARGNWYIVTNASVQSAKTVSL